MLIGSRSIIHSQYPPNIWRIRPDYDGNIMHSKVTHYAHVSLGGSLPTWLVNEASVDMPSGTNKGEKIYW